MRADNPANLLMVTVAKGAHRWVFLYRADRHGEMLDIARHYAADPDVDFDQSDYVKTVWAAAKLADNPSPRLT